VGGYTSVTTLTTRLALGLCHRKESPAVARGRRVTTSSLFVGKIFGPPLDGGTAKQRPQQPHRGDEGIKSRSHPYGYHLSPTSSSSQPSHNTTAVILTTLELPQPHSTPSPNLSARSATNNHNYSHKYP
jgi:hypothetical protein